MPRVKGSTTTIAVLSIGGLIAGCQSAPAHYADSGVHATYEAATVGAGAIRTTGVEIYHGAGRAVRAPFQDLNMMQDPIPPVLLRAENQPYDLTGVDSCADVLNRVSELDLSLGPDVDTPKERGRTRASRGASFAASTAIDAAGSAVEHFIPMRSTIKQISGATRYQRHKDHAVLAGETRRSFLKAVGMAHGCSWPAAPLSFKPVRVADVNASWSGSSTSGSVLLASAPSMSAASTAPRPGAAVDTLHMATLARPTSPATGATPSRVVMVSSASARPTPVFIQVPWRMTIPAVPQGAADPGQAWRPAPSLQASSLQPPSMQAHVVEVSSPMLKPPSSVGMSEGSGLAAASPPSSSATAPWASSLSVAPTTARP
jgi:hypothetical protein